MALSSLSLLSQQSKFRYTIDCSNQKMVQANQLAQKGNQTRKKVLSRVIPFISATLSKNIWQLGRAYFKTQMDFLNHAELRLLKKCQVEESLFLIRDMVAHMDR